MFVCLFFSFVLIFGDQALKFWIKTSFYLKQSESVFGGKFFQLHFVENEGFAFGLAFFGETGKLLLTILRFILSGFVLFYIINLIKKRQWWTTVPFILIFSGATANLIDCVFYGVIFSESFPVPGEGVAVFLGDEGGYAPLFFGRVVDMFYFDIFDVEFPNWVPFLGGKNWKFFQYVFNLADSYITIGAFLLFFINPFKSVSNKKQ